MGGSRQSLDRRHDHSYTYACVYGVVARKGTGMNQTTSASRVVVIAGTAPASKKPSYRQPSKQQKAAYRIVVIRNNQLVDRRPGR